MNWLSFITPEYIGLAIGGFFACIGIFNVANRLRRSDDTAVAQNLIENLKSTLEQQKETIAQMKAEMAETTTKRNAEIQQLRDELSHLQGRNSILEELFKGRDPRMEEVFKDAPAIFDIARENNAMSKSNNQAITKLTETFEKFINSLQSILMHIESKGLV